MRETDMVKGKTKAATGMNETRPEMVCPEREPVPGGNSPGGSRMAHRLGSYVLDKDVSLWLCQLRMEANSLGRMG